MKETTKSDKKWGRFNAKLQELMKAQDFWGLGVTYYEMANFMDEEGKNSTAVRKLGYEMKLKVNEANLEEILQSDVATKVEIIGAPDSCEACKKLNGSFFPTSEAKRSNLLPVKACIHPFGCRCVYGPAFD